LDSFGAEARGLVFRRSSRDHGNWLAKTASRRTISSA
jgi:hypothetical protein